MILTRGISVGARERNVESLMIGIEVISKYDLVGNVQHLYCLRIVVV